MDSPTTFLWINLPVKEVCGLSMSARNQTANNTRSKRRIALRIAFGLLLALICGEVFLRVTMGNCALGRIMEFDTDKAPCVRMIPGAKIIHTGFLKKITPVVHSVNPFGYRGQARLPQKHEGVFRIVIAGDSNTFCPGIADDDDYPARLEDYLNRTGGRKFEVLNFGVPGLNLEEVMDYIRFKALAFQPDLVLAQISRNDFEASQCANLSLRRRSLIAIIRYIYLARVLFILEDYRFKDNETFDKNVDRMKRFASDLVEISRENETPIAVIGFYDPMMLGDEFITRFFHQSGISYFPLPKNFDSFLVHDLGHLSKPGCDQYATSLASWLINNAIITVN